MLLPWFLTTIFYVFCGCNSLFIINETQTAPHTNITCPSDDNCQIDCKDCHSSSIFCPTNPNFYCEINCLAESSCYQSIIWGESSNKLTINPSGNAALSEAIITAPINGDLEIIVDARYGNNQLESSTILTPSNSGFTSNSITIECSDILRNTPDNEYNDSLCTGLTINATNANSLNFKCSNYTDCRYTNILCPVGSEATLSCQIECLNETSCSNATIYSQSGVNVGVAINCDTSSICNGMTVFCDYLFDQNCSMRNDIWSNGNWTCDGDCIGFDLTDSGII